MAIFSNKGWSCRLLAWEEVPVHCSTTVQMTIYVSIIRRIGRECGCIFMTPLYITLSLAPITRKQE